MGRPSHCCFHLLDIFGHNNRIFDAWYYDVFVLLHDPSVGSILSMFCSRVFNLCFHMTKWLLGAV